MDHLTVVLLLLLLCQHTIRLNREVDEINRRFTVFRVKQLRREMNQPDSPVKEIKRETDLLDKI